MAIKLMREISLGYLHRSSSTLVHDHRDRVLTNRELREMARASRMFLALFPQFGPFFQVWEQKMVRKRFTSHAQLENITGECFMPHSRIIYQPVFCENKILQVIYSRTKMTFHSPTTFNATFTKDKSN